MTEKDINTIVEKVVEVLFDTDKMKALLGRKKQWINTESIEDFDADVRSIVEEVINGASVTTEITV